MAKIISITSEKGGVGKTTTTINLGAALAKLGKKVLCIDTDPKPNMSQALGFGDDDGLPTFTTLMDEAIKVNPDLPQLTQQSIRNYDDEFDYIPSSRALLHTEETLIYATLRELVLKRILDVPSLKEQYDYILLDCPQGFGLINTNSLAASNGVIIPVETQFFACDSLHSVVDAVKLARVSLNPSLEIYGILLTLADNTVLTKIVTETVGDFYEGVVFPVAISKRVEVGYSQAHRKTLLSDSKSVVGAEYLAVAKELIERGI